ncbi:elongation factor G [Desulfonatronum sp. SC1]|uniref:elongation factor G n=1 Tax=Desulfonatronum sp. SC1 TaxID=2109626 RepID=UPI000D326A43|nr:elongation factor G [Desulfonatronum sp. SC1]PTN38049.1 elongation factor G [Desulfonatronum sp. SC1]
MSKAKSTPTTSFPAHGPGKRSSLSLVRNIGIIAHIDAGKTTVTERILYFSGAIHRMGEVHEGNATMDYLPEEQERGITITSACTTTQWHEYILNIIDTPGHVDFTIEVERSLRVLDGAVGVFCAVGGVEPQSETVWRQSEKFGVPKLAFINKLDRLGADFAAVLEDMRSKLRTTPLPLQIPDGQGQDFKGVIDLLRMRFLSFPPEDKGANGQWQEAELTAEQELAAQPWREQILEKVAEQDDALLEAYLSGLPMDLDAIQAVIRHATLKGALVPVLCGSALKNAGIQPLLDAICFYLPSPEDAPAAKGVHPVSHDSVSLSADPGGPLAALVFKITIEAGRRLAYTRVYSGTLAEGEQIRNVTQGQDERIAHIYRMHADKKQRLDSAQAGLIVALAGCKVTRTGDTLATLNSPVLLEQITAYQPVISLALEPKTQADAKKLSEALQFFLLQDPTLFLSQDEETDQLILSGMGELHLDVVLERMHREYGVSPRTGNPQVLHQETILKPAEGQAVFERELAKIPHFGAVRIAVAPRDRDTGNAVRWTMDIQGWPETWIKAVEQGVADGLQSGVAKGYPVQDVLVEIVHLERRDGESSPVGYQMAAAQALKQALNEAGPVLLEPIMDIEMTVPDEFVGEVIGLFNSRGGRVGNMFDRSGAKVITGRAPMRQLFGFSTALRSASQGRAGFTMRFARFDALA